MGVMELLNAVSTTELWAARMEKVGVSFRRVADCAYELSPRGTPAESLMITVLGAVHGNEVGGLAAVHELLTLVASGVVKLPGGIGLAVGNPAGVRAGTRFTESDLNRSFGGTKTATFEDRRARELETLLSRSRFLIDLHQTTEHSDRAFYIFPHARRSLAFAARVMPHLALVTHWGDAFSREGMCTDEFVNQCGGTGITLELGQSGLAPYQVALAVQVALRAFSALGQEDAESVPEFSGEIFTFGETLPYPEGDVALVPGLYNFKDIAAGTVVARSGGQDIRVEQSGRVLFPKYQPPKPGQNRTHMELMRILRPLSPKDLPQG